MTSFTRLNAWIANASMFCSRSVPLPVSSSTFLVPLLLATAKATYPLISCQGVISMFRGTTYGVRLGVEPPVGPAVPLCDACQPLTLRNFLAWGEGHLTSSRGLVRRTLSTYLGDAVCRFQLGPDILSQACHNIWRGAFIAVNVGLGPACELNSWLQRI